MYLGSVRERANETLDGWNNHNIPRLAAALAFYTIFSLAPLVVIVLAVAGLFLGPKAAEGQLLAQVRNLVGPQGASAIQLVVHSAYRPHAGIIALDVGIVMLMLGAIGVFNELRSSLNTIWDAPPRVFLLGAYVKGDFLSFVFVLGTGFLLMATMLFTTALNAAEKFAGYLIKVPPYIIETVNTGGSIVLFTILFAVIFKVLPDVRVRWRDVWFGAFVSSLLFAAGKILVGLYLGRSTINSSYGAASSLVVFNVWIYYSAQIFLLGAQFTQVDAARRHRALEERLKQQPRRAASTCVN